MSNSHPNPEYQFKPGQSGNPAGKPKGVKNFTTKVREALEKISEGQIEPEGVRLVKAILHNAIEDRKPESQKLLMNYLDGMPLQTIKDITADDEPTDAELNAAVAAANAGGANVSAPQKEGEV